VNTPANTPRPSGAQLPELVDAPYVIGNAYTGTYHAVSHDGARQAFGTARNGHAIALSECSTLVCVVNGWGAWRRPNRVLRPGSTCPTCAWQVAIKQDTIPAELDAITPTGRLLDVMRRQLRTPLLARRVCEAILSSDLDYEVDHPYTVALLAQATAHAPQALLPEACAEDSCDHLPDVRVEDLESGACRAWECPWPEADLGCSSCSIVTDYWAGAWAGTYVEQCTIPGPCQPLRTLAEHYGVDAGTPA
jgi:hypothetical protein